MKKQVTMEHLTFLRSVVEYHRKAFVERADIWAYAEYGKALMEYNDAMESLGSGVPDMYIPYDGILIMDIVTASQCVIGG